MFPINLLYNKFETQIQQEKEEYEEQNRDEKRKLFTNTVYTVNNTAWLKNANNTYNLDWSTMILFYNIPNRVSLTVPFNWNLRIPDYSVLMNIHW